MSTIRNEGTAAGREMWRKVDEAAQRAPDWVKSHIKTLTTQIATPAPDSDINKQHLSKVQGSAKGKG